ncbi:MAG: hypothetical protein MZW92_78250 [Comamonadaceae bacterium]|nr:hypothetical protein [Comamonadaceae bacterium]
MRALRRQRGEHVPDEPLRFRRIEERHALEQVHGHQRPPAWRRQFPQFRLQPVAEFVVRGDDAPAAVPTGPLRRLQRVFGFPLVAALHDFDNVIQQARSAARLARRIVEQSEDLSRLSQQSKARASPQGKTWKRSIVTEARRRARPDAEKSCRIGDGPIRP